MEIQKSFSHSAFGGFKKEEVTDYLTRLEEEYNREVGELRTAVGAGNTQITELKSIIEQQYQKIVDAAKENDELHAAEETLHGELAEKEREIRNLRERLAPYEEADRSAREIVEAAAQRAKETITQAKEQSASSMAEADRYLEELRQQSDALLAKASEQAKAMLSRAEEKVRSAAAEAAEKAAAVNDEAEEQAKVILGQANEQAKAILAPAGEQAKQLVAEAEEEARRTTEQAQQIFNAAKDQAQTIVESAKQKEQELLEQARRNIEENVSLSEENEKRSEQLLSDAEKEADRIVRNARYTAREEKEHYEDCLKNLELQKSTILMTLDEIKARIQAVQITRPRKSDAELVQEKRLTTTEALKRKFTLLNNRDLGAK